MVLSLTNDPSNTYYRTLPDAKKGIKSYVSSQCNGMVIPQEILPSRRALLDLDKQIVADNGLKPLVNKATGEVRFVSIA